MTIFKLKLTILVGLVTFGLVQATDPVNYIPKPTPTRHFDHYVQLDTTGQYWLFWTANDTHITFETHVNTHGYIGLGISPNGKMFPADVIVGGVKDGQTYFKDYHTTQHAPPIVDQSQDWFLIAGKETASGTVLTFVRKLNTCDSADDMVITSDTTRIIFSYHPDDVAGSIPYHGATRRGTKSVMLLSSSLTADDVNMPSDAVTFDFLQKSYHVPNDTTVYSCQTFTLPPLASKHHMIKYEPIITPGNELVVHHMVVFHCNQRAAELTSYSGAQFRCGRVYNTPKPLQGCYHSFVAWALGGTTFYYPPDTGFSLGTANDPDFFVMETHYNNPTAKAGIVDSSGIRITMTPTLRKHDAGLLLLGMGVSRMHIIPPMEPNFVSQAFCPSSFLKKGIPPEGIQIFAVLQHSHLLGRQMITRIHRNGREIKPLVTDRHFDFDFQDMRYLSEKRTIYPTDKLELNCVYDSSHRQNITQGGVSTQDEMCEAFILYYPRMHITSCESTPVYDTITDDVDDVIPIIKTWNWTDATVRTRFRSALEKSKYIHYISADIDSLKSRILTAENATEHPFVEPPDTTCQQISGLNKDGK
ncbi:DBH-like monooxygenase protein 1 [Pecten maximus]|uniref:DBH-like monooxygenase protein 1 n=1 Tax=Pecten maximus TaxID=6579 RepID=UPI001458A664|nr:DBH-like monooxygenase protein 1 [Pecten maximus]